MALREYSALSVMQMGMAPPSPRPVRKRSITSALSESDAALAKVATPNTSTDISSTGLRPNRSATGPSPMLPSMSPKSPAPKAGASCGGVRCHASRSAGAM